MNAAAEARQSELDRRLDAQKPSSDLAAELFALTDLLRAQAPLRNALADPTRSDASRRELAKSLLSGRASTATLAVASEAVGLNWGTPSRLLDAFERQGLRALLHLAQAAGRLDAVEEELFRFSRTVVADQALRSALDSRAADPQALSQLVADLLAGRVEPVTLELAKRAVVSPKRSFELTIDSYLRLSAAVRQRSIAVVTVAKPLAAAQVKRLEATLSAQLGHQINLQMVVDPNVLGGARVQVGDEVIEGTVAGRLAAAEQQLTQ